MVRPKTAHSRQIDISNTQAYNSAQQTVASSQQPTKVGRNSLSKAIGNNNTSVGRKMRKNPDVTTES